LEEKFKVEGTTSMDDAKEACERVETFMRRLDMIVLMTNMGFEYKDLQLVLDFFRGKEDISSEAAKQTLCGILDFMQQDADIVLLLEESGFDLKDLYITRNYFS